MDLALDVIVFPDGSWRWKDDDELATYVERGVLDGELAKRLKDEGMTAVHRAANGEPPFDEPWPSWRPEPGWSAPALPEDWEVACR
jgi:hypothetical protein